MKNILLIGIGGTGSAAIDLLHRKIKNLGNQAGNCIAAIVFDTKHDSAPLQDGVVRLSLSDTADIGTICDRIGTQYLKDWFHCDDPSIRAQNASRDSSVWRKNAYLSFLNMLNRSEERARFHRTMEDLNQKNPEAIYEIYVITSIAGGTGSGACLPIALYAHHYVTQHIGKIPQIHVLIACPDIVAHQYAADEQMRFHANAYAFLRELNAINLVAHGYNRTAENEGKAPVRFRLGNPEEPLAGLLFDSEDERFWDPSAAPIQKVFVVDKLPGVHSVEAHDGVIADTLYTILCTDVGTSNDSEFSNHVMLNAQKGGSNAIYAVISTSQVQFPTESILTYLAYEKVRESCKDTWLTLHEHVKQLIKEKNIRDRENGVCVCATPTPLEYATLYTAAYTAETKDPQSQIPTIAERGMMQSEESAPEIPDSARLYFHALLDAIERRISCTQPQGTESLPVTQNPSALKDFAEMLRYRRESAKKRPAHTESGKHSARLDVLDFASKARNALLSVFRNGISTIRSTYRGIADSVLSLMDTDPPSLSAISVTEHLLKHDGKYVHPVAAMVRLCRLRVLVNDFLENNRAALDNWEKLWRRASDRELEERWGRLLICPDITPESSRLKLNKSFYYGLGNNRFGLIGKSTDSERYRTKRTDVLTDSVCLREDVASVFRNIRGELILQLQCLVLNTFSSRLDTLIDEYRIFFAHFEDARRELDEQTQTALHRDTGRVNSVFNVNADIAQKQTLLDRLLRENTGESLHDIERHDDIVGEQVFLMAHDAAVRRKNNIISKDVQGPAAMMRALFENMMHSYRDLVRESDTFRAVADMNAIEAIASTLGPNPSEKRLCDAISQTLSSAREAAKPSLKIEGAVKNDDSPCPAELTVLLMSRGTAKYIKKEAHRLGIEPPQGATEETAIYGCAEQFAKKFVSHASRVSVVSEIPDQLLYITDEKLDIVPRRILKFDELSGNASYYHSYCHSLEYMTSYGTDRWNPHLGNGLHKPGRLPFLNEEMASVQERRLVKALLYAFLEQRFICRDNVFYRSGISGMSADEPLIYNGEAIGVSELPLLFEWLREHNEHIDPWAAAFETELKRQKNTLPAFSRDEDFIPLEQAILRLPYVRSLCVRLFEPSDLNLGQFAETVRRLTPSSVRSRDASAIRLVAEDIAREFSAYRASAIEPEDLELMRQSLLGKMGYSSDSR